MKNKNIYNTEIIKRLKEKYGVSRRFITMSINSDRTSETSEKIKDDYKNMKSEVEKTLNNL